MFKRFIAILLAFTIVFTTYSMPLSFAEGGTINLPSVVGISSFAWEGKNPIVGEKTFYIEVLGNGFLNHRPLEAEVFIKDSEDYTKVASQIEGVYLGLTELGNERFMFKMSMEGELVLKDGVNYYIDVKDSSGNYLLEDRSKYYFIAYTPYISISVGDINVKDIASTIDNLPIEFTIYGLDKDISPNDINIELVKGEIKEGSLTPVGDMSKSTMAVDEGQYGDYAIHGTMNIYGNLSGGDKLYIQASSGDSVGYSFSYINVLDGNIPNAKNFTIINGLGKDNEFGHEQHGDENNTENVFFIDNDTSILDFEFIGTQMLDQSKITVSMSVYGENIGNLVPGSVNINPVDNNLYSVNGQVNIGGSIDDNIGAILKTFYDGTIIDTTIIKKTGIQGASNLKYEDNSYHYGTVYEVDPLLPIVLTLENTINLTPQAITATLNNGSGEISIGVTAQKNGNDIFLTLTPSSFNGLYNLELYHGGMRINQIYFEQFEGMVGSNGTIIDDVNKVSFNFTDNPDLVLKTIVSQENDLFLKGNGFTLGKNYTAYFLKRINSSLTATPFEVNASYISNKTLRLNESQLKLLPRGWYTVYLKEDDIHVKGFADTSLRTPTTGEPVVILPKVKINDDDIYTTVPNVIFGFTPGTYDQVKFAETESELTNAPWRSITSEIPFTLSEGYGMKTVYFVFKSSFASDYAINKTIEYRSTSLKDMVGFGVVGGKQENNILILNEDNSYTIFIKSDQLNLTGIVEFLDEKGDLVPLVHPEALKRTGTIENTHTYSKKININNSFKDVKKLKFYLKDINNFTSKDEILDVEIRKEALISNVKTTFKEFYHYETYVGRGSNVQYELWGTPGFTATAKLNYKDLEGTNKSTTELILNGDSKGYYKNQLSLPLDIASITNIEYILTDPTSPENTITKIDEKSRRLGGELNFSGLKNYLGDYNGKILSLYSDNPWLYKQITITENQTSFQLKGLPPSNNYSYSIYDRNKTYANGNIELSPGKEENINLSEGSIPAKVKFAISPELANLKIYVQNYGYLQNNKEYDGFVKGEKINYSLYLQEKDFKTYKIPDNLSATINGSLETINISLEPFEKINFIGTVVDEKIPSRKLEGANISFRQSVPNGSYNNIYYYDNVTTDANGNFEIQLYKDYPVSFDITKDGYDYKNLDLDQATQEQLNNIKDIGLSYSTKNQISVNLFARPLVEQNTTVDNSVLLGLDNNKVSHISVTDENDKYVSAYFYQSNSYIYVPENNQNKTLRLKFHFYDMEMEEPYYEVKLDEYGNGVVNVVALSSGAVKANIVTGGDNSPTAYMILYDNKGNLSGIVSGSGSLSSENLVLKEGNYTAILLKGYELNKLNNMKTIDAFNLLGLQEDIHYIKRNINLEHNKLTNLGDIIIPELTSADILSISKTSIKTRFIPNNGNGLVHVMARFNPELVDPESTIVLKSIGIFSSGSIQSNKLYLNGEEHNGSYIYPPSDSPIDGTLFFSLIPPSMDQLNLTIRVEYLIDGNKYIETFGVDDIDAPKISIIAPSEVFMGDDAKEVNIRGIGIPESRIEIYDNNRLVGETIIPAKKSTYQTTVSLIDRDIPVAHTLYAKMITKDNEEYISSSKICEIIDPKTMAYTSNFVFRNGYNSLTSNTPKDSNENIIFTYVPYKNSEVSFHINNLLKDQLEYVALVVTNNDQETYYEVEHVEDVANGDSKYSKWQLETRLREVGDFSIYYSLKNNEPLAPISGSKPIDFEQAIESQDIDPAYMPTSLRENLDNRVISKNSDTELDISVPVEGGGHVRVTGKFSENHRITEAELRSLGYRKFDTIQGYYWAKEDLSNDGTNLEYHKSIYFSPQLTQILKSNSIGSKLKRQPNNILAMAYSSDFPLQILSPIQMLSSVDDTLSKADYAGYVFGVADIVNDTSPNPANFGKVGTGMQVLGGVVLAGQILSGPTSKDHNTLYEAAAKIDDAVIRSRLGDEIREYDRARRSSHSVSTLFGGVSYGASFAGFVGKGLSYVVSTGGMIYGQKTGVELDIWWDAVMRDIQNELTLQEARKNKKDKPPKPGKKDDQKKPNWKIDPSGYVFEAIDSNRIEGVTSTALAYNSLIDDFLFWDEAEDWDEINPVLSDQDGKYGWDVPPGDWKVRFEKEGYLTSETKSMTVPPAHEEVNIGLLSTKTPEVSGVAMDSGGIEIEFNMFMQGESIVNNISILDKDGFLVPYEKIDFIIGTEDKVYKSDGIYQRDIVASTDFVKRIRLIVDQELYPGGFRLFEDDGETPAKYDLVVRENVQSYAGVQMTEDFIEENIQVVERQKITTPSANIPEGDYGTEQTITLTTTTEGATIYYTLDGSQPTALSSVYKNPITIRKTTIIKFFASKVGMDNSDIISLRYNIVKGLPNTVAKPTANISSGTYDKALDIVLSTTTEGADIYYTRDGSIPTKLSSKYTGPIRVSSTETIKAIAVKSGYVDSDIAIFNYTITTSSDGGSGSTGGAGGGGGSGSIDTSGNKPTLTLDKVNPILKFKGKAINGELVGILDEVSANRLIENAKNNESQSIVIEMETSDLLKRITFEQPKTFLKDVVNKTKGKIKYISPLAEITLSRKSIEALSNENGTKFSLIVEKMDNGYSITLQIDGKNIEKIDGDIIVTIPKEKLSENTVVMRVGKDGSLQIIPKSIVRETSISVKLNGSETIRVVENKKFFKDIENHWANNAIRYVTARELFSGTSVEVFNPNLSMTRGMLVTVLHRLEGQIKVPIKSFNDVDHNKYYAPAIYWASANGVVEGIGGKLFAPDQVISREQLAVMIYRYGKFLGLDTSIEKDSISKFKDQDQVSSWASTAMNYAINSGLINGKNGSLDPKGNATRGEVATIIQRFMQKLYD